MKNNLWNRLFHYKQLEESKKEYEKSCHIVSVYSSLVNKIKNAKNLLALFELHKEAWSEGFQNKNLGPDMFGMFRCESIEDMKPSQVFLGGVYGLHTFSIPEWELRKTETYGVNQHGYTQNTRCYDIMVDVYKDHLLSNMYYINEKAKEKIVEHEYC